MTSESPGSRLKVERERRGWSIQKAADDLHLDLWVIEGLEADQYERVGPAVYAKGHLKQYAEMLGIPSGEILTSYAALAQGSLAQGTPKSVTPQNNVKIPATSGVPTNLPWPLILGAAGVIVLLVGGVSLWMRFSGRMAPPTVGVPVSAPASATQSAPAPGQESGLSDLENAGVPLGAARGVTAPSSNPSTARREAEPGAGRVRLRMSFSADSRVVVRDATGKNVFAGTGYANSVKNIAGSAPMHVYLGFASGVQLEINERAVAIGPQFVGGDVARFAAGADGVLRHDREQRP
jgi:cytoskeleton protein RodZ